MRIFLNFLGSLGEQLRDPVFRATFSILAVLILVGTVFYSFVEGWSLLDSLYFCVITAATVGFGDFAPRTDAGKVFTIVYVLMSVGLLVLVLSRISSGMVQRRMEKHASRPGATGGRVATDGSRDPGGSDR